MMLAFDTPIPFSSVGRRNTSNVPAQALILLNDPFVQHEAEHWARRLIEQFPDPAARLDRAFLEAFSREPTERDRSQVAMYLAEQATELNIGEADRASSVELWTGLCHVLWNAKEFTYLR